MGFSFYIRFYNPETEEEKIKRTFEPTLDFFEALRNTTEKAIEFYKEIWNPKSPNKYWKLMSINVD